MYIYLNDIQIQMHPVYIVILIATRYCYSIIAYRLNTVLFLILIFWLINVRVLAGTLSDFRVHTRCRSQPPVKAKETFKRSEVSFDHKTGPVLSPK